MDENTGSEGAREEGGEQGTDWHRLASRVGLDEGNTAVDILLFSYICIFDVFKYTAKPRDNPFETKTEKLSWF